MNQIIHEFVSSLEQHRFDAAERYFSDDLAAAYPSSRLESDWHQLENRLGEFETVNEIRVEGSDTHRIRNVTLVFADGVQVIRVVFPSTGDSIVGLQYSSQEQHETTLPDYVEETEFTRESVVIGSDEYPLSGELALPVTDDPHPGVVLVHGSGPHDMDSSINVHKPFRDIGYGLPSQGIATLRYNKRTFTYELDRTECTIDHVVVDDAVNAVEKLGDQEKVSEVFVVGHSLGGMLAPEIIRRSPAQGGVLLAANARRLEDVVINQYRALVDIGEVDAAQMETLEEEYTRIRNHDWDRDSELLDFPGSFWDSLSEYDPVRIAFELDCPLGIAQGRQDAQISVHEDFEVWKSELRTKDNVEYKLFDNLNHLFAETQDTEDHSWRNQKRVSNDLIQWLSDWCTKTR